MKEKKDPIIIFLDESGWLISWRVGDLIPWPGPQIMSVASMFLDPLTIEIQSSPSLHKYQSIN